MSDYTFMDPAVDELCESMVKNPGRWTISTYTLIDEKSGLAYWIGATSYGRFITELSTPGTTTRVFSNNQGERLGEAFGKLREIKASQAQQKILSAHQPISQEGFISRFCRWLTC